MRTTITLDEDVAAKLEEERRKSGRSFKETVNYFLRLGLHHRQQSPPPTRFRVEARDLGLRPGIELDNIGELLEQLEGPEHR